LRGKHPRLCCHVVRRREQGAFASAAAAGQHRPSFIRAHRTPPSRCARASSPSLSPPHPPPPPPPPQPHFPFSACCVASPSLHGATTLNPFNPSNPTPNRVAARAAPLQSCAGKAARSSKPPPLPPPPPPLSPLHAAASSIAFLLVHMGALRCDGWGLALLHELLNRIPNSSAQLFPRRSRCCRLWGLKAPKRATRSRSCARASPSSSPLLHDK
jgi:hypothetical protein